MLQFLDNLTFWHYIIFINALVGWVSLEWSWNKFRRFRNPNKDLDAIYPCYARADAAKWQKWKLYPGAMTIMIPRFIFISLAAVALLVWLNIIMMGQTKG